MTYQRPTPVNKQSWSGKPGAPFGKQAPKPASEVRNPVLDLKLADIGAEDALKPVLAGTVLGPASALLRARRAITNIGESPPKPWLSTGARPVR